MPITLRPDGEISLTDFYLTDAFARQAKVPQWERGFKPNFSDIRKLDESKDDQNYQLEVIQFLSEHMEGPFFVQQMSHSHTHGLQVTLFTEEDIQTFQTEYPEWRYHETAHPENMQLVAKRQTAGWEPKSRSMQDFLRNFTPA